ncbi:MAG: hypothetical protein SAJ37_12480 [Oscillatoria sp. PMC 1068.18]|nr:hypothetical protein [Oscillatoria sp. PMC 1076.18]MEC4989559.1 hypothetical protein [Oscillatoria sp. PMC 1068.18]
MKNLKLVPKKSQNSSVQSIATWLPKPETQTSTWVKLRELPTPYSHDEALILCQISVDEWVAWIPNCGERILNRSQFV